ncbi:MAG: hypothetical protein EBZ53_07600, partial [Verrucomicrobia bacterium]|nr:hypothetical protein [Verrucomicrobiota bacterium]
MKDVPKIADAACALKVPVKGISFHVGSGCGNALQYYKAIRAAYYGLSFLPRTGSKPIIDIGGGFTGGNEFEEAALQIRRAQASCD